MSFVRSFSKSWAALALVAAALPAGAQDHPNVAKGFWSEHAFEFGEIDHVSTFSGNLVVTVPIGGRYPVNALAYGFNVVGNGQIWEAKEEAFNTVALRPSPVQNAGAGFLFTLGRILGPTPPLAYAEHLSYLAPDGSTTQFFDTLHNEDTDEDVGTQETTYSRASNYLRLRHVGNLAVEYELDLGNGETHSFDAQGRLIAIYDRYFNLVSITYENPTASTERWTIDDGIRVHTVDLESFNVDGTNRMLVRQIHLAAFDGTTATYTLTYTQALIRRACPDTSGSTAEFATVSFLDAIELPDGSSFSMNPIADSYVTDASVADCKLSGVIKRLRLPTLGYLEWDHQVVFLPEESVTDDDGTVKLHHSRPIGVRERRKVRADRETLEGRWTYRHQIGGGTPQPNPTPDRWKKTTIVEPLGDKTVHHFSVWPNDPNSPEGYRAVEYGLPFSRLISDGASGTFISTETSDCDANPADPSNPLNCVAVRNSFVRYETDTVGVTALEDKTQLNQRLAESKVVYLDDANHFTTIELAGADGLGHYRSEVRGGDFPAGAARTASTTWNSLRGNYPGAGWNEIPADDPWLLETFDSISRGEAVVACSSETTTTETATEEYCFDPDTGFLRAKRLLKMATGSRSGDDVLLTWEAGAGGNVDFEAWIGGDGAGLSTTASVCNLADSPPASDFRMAHTYENGARKSSRYTDDDDIVGNDPPLLNFLVLDRDNDPNTGLPIRTRDTAGLLTTFDYDTLGRLITVDPSVGNGAAEEVFTYSRALSTSTLAKVVHEVFENGSGSAILLKEEVRFDGFGRLARELRSRSSTIEDSRYTFYDEGGHRAFVSEWGRDSIAGEFGLAYENFDPFGRPRALRRWFNEPAAQPEVTLVYRGGREVERTIDVGSVLLAGGEIGTEPITTTERYDHFGRLVAVVEPSDGLLTGVETKYAYDAGNRLHRAKTLAPGAVPDQVRCWSYDQRGFLDTEQHPEKVGIVDYGAHDAMGHATTKSDGGIALKYTFDRAARLREVRDGADNDLLKEWRYSYPSFGDSAAIGQLWKAISQERPLLTAGAVDFRIEEEFSYGEPGGRLGKRVVKACGGLVDCVPATTGDEFEHLEHFDDRGQRTSIVYPECNPTTPASDCPGAAQIARTVGSDYFYGLPTAVTPSWATSITYHSNELWKKITHGNGVADEQFLSFDRRARPKLLTTTKAANTLWRSGTFLYDPAGNITGFGQTGTDPIEPASVIALDELDGADRFLYDRVHRLVASTISVPEDTPGACLFCDGYESGDVCRWDAEEGALESCSPGGAPAEGFTTRRQDYSFDLYGNIQSISTDGLFEDTTTNEATNRLTAQGAAFDARGNLVTWVDPGTSATTQFYYDELNRLVRREVSGEPTYHFLYTADDERILTYVESSTSPSEFRWTLRDFGGKVLRSYRQSGGPLQVARDHIFRGDQPLAEVDYSSGSPVTFHLSLDHLGSPRAKTDAAGNAVLKWKYFPFGEEAIPAPQVGSLLRFTGHERDQFSQTGASDDLDYMHARLGVPLIGRFASVDAEQGDPEEPQSWNRYSYALASPITMVDRNGRDPERFSGMMRQFVENPSLLQGHQDAGKYATIGIAGMGIVGAGGAAVAEARLVTALGQAFAAYGTTRGNLIEGILASRFGGALPRVFPVIDRFLNGVATSVKSLDLASRSYQDAGRLSSTIQSFVTKLAEFQGAAVGRFAVTANSITSRVLELVVQASKMSPEQAAAIEKLLKSAQDQGVTIKLIQAR